MPKKVYLANGKRKTSIAKAALKQDGSGRIFLNKVPHDVLPEMIHRELINELIYLIGKEIIEKVDIYVTMSGGGKMSQINAARTAIARAVVNYKRSSRLRSKIQDYDRTLLSGDARHNEPKKFGGPGARARKQKSYR
ncbi:30S ribosomal protein S9 [Candidatus Bathyarchaeota archaeon]|nr:30S ribosomal protein S9 [Candidatus Bathyarchaeota archaeon]